MAKTYEPMALEEAEDYLATKAIDIPDTASGIQVLQYAETLKLHERLDEIENQATEMMSPEKMMEMAQNFLGGGIKF